MLATIIVRSGNNWEFFVYEMQCEVCSKVQCEVYLLNSNRLRPIMRQFILLLPSSFLISQCSAALNMFNSLRCFWTFFLEGPRFSFIGCSLLLCSNLLWLNALGWKSKIQEGTETIKSHCILPSVLQLQLYLEIYRQILGSL